ncbi:penicillin-binding transpeptidase domain-containing protein [Actinomycetospora termitidis]|uniref:Penicillin-binding transpeptidase domain-containing protein n=1 Tax=Actinomycetospora termitidis TaxID=3053470 RepID=A0ABT7MC97_9PSEU|nr:penicillin-binding transpeptidase domain-containing protein [Actinomycetospora sp. Odt1-22]MDL5158081.1 penicillin-binding transpeptidase domain-containing protein [Actinomycetospora sp. Odt1-22]
MRRAAWALPAVLAAGLAGLLPAPARPEPILWAVGAAVLAVPPCLAARRHPAVVGTALLAATLGTLVPLRLGAPAGRVAFVAAAASVLLTAGVVVGRSPRLGRGLERPASRRLAALAALAAGLVLRALTLLGPAPASGTLPLLGVQVGELTRWLVVGGAALAVAEQVSRAPGWRASDRRFHLLAGGLGAGALALLVVVRDLGPAALVVVAVLAAVVHVRGLPVRWVVAGALAVVVAIPLLATVPVVRGRALEVVDPGDQLRAALTAAWSGGLIGPGPGRSPLVDGVPAIGSDYAVAALVADLGALVVVPVLLGLLAALAHLVRVAAARRGAAASLAVALATALVAQGAWNALGTVAVLPLTGLNAPFLGFSRASLTTSALVLGLVVGLLDRPDRTGRTAPGTSALTTATVGGVRGVAVLLVAAAVLLVVGPRTISDAEQVRMPRGTIWTADGRVIAADDGAGRTYPAGGRYADLGFARWNGTHRGVEAVAADTLTCGGALGAADVLAGLFHPVCRPADVVTTVDSRVQAALAAGVAGLDGEAVLLDARTGAVTGLFSSASTEPGVPSRARSRQGPPGSTMKLVTAAAALLAGVDPAAAPLGAYRGDDGSVLGNDGGSTCPAADTATALAHSCNSVLGWEAVQVGAPELARVARTWFGADTPVRLDGLDAAGLDTGLGAADPGTGALARTGIGQESVRSTVLGVALATAVVANAGTTTPWPSVIAATCPGGDPEPTAPSAPIGRPLPGPVADVIRGGMARAVSEGTARRLAPAGHDVVAKTGTAQVPGGATDSWVTAIVDDRWVLTLVAHGAAREGTAVDAGSRVLGALPPVLTPVPPTCPGEARPSALLP